MVPGVEFHADRAAGDIAGVFRSDYKKSILRPLPENHSKKRGEGEISYIYEEMQDCISGENMELHVENMELAEMINRFLAGMKTENRRIFVRRYWYFDSIAEIAKRFSISESKVKSSLMRSRESLRKCLAQEGIEV